MKKDYLLIASTFVGTIIGAGFASGREIVRFFGEYGYLSIFFILFAGALFYYFTYIMLDLGKKKQYTNITETTKVAFKDLAPTINFLMIAAYVVGVASMLSATDALSFMIFPSFPPYIFTLILSVLSVIVVVGGIKRLSYVNLFLTPVIIVLLIFICIKFIVSNPAESLTFLPTFKGLTPLAASFFMLLYVFMNMQIASEVMILSGRKISKKSIRLAAAIGSLLVTICIALVVWAVLRGGQSIFNSDMPLVIISLSVGNFAGYIYSVVMLGGIFSTLIAASLLVTQWLNTKVKSKLLSVMVVTIVGFLLSRIGFMEIVEYLYPVTGVIGAIFVIGIVVHYYKMRNNQLE